MGVMYKKTVDIKYNNKVFAVFVNLNNKRIFLEVTNKGYKFPSKKDYADLNNLYNNRDDFVVAGEVSFKRKVQGTVAGVLAGVTLLSAVVFKKQETSPDETPNIENSEQQKEEVWFTTSLELDNILGYKDVALEKVYQAIENNSNLDDEYKRLATLVINTIDTYDKKAEKRIFFLNIGDLDVRVDPLEKIKEVKGEGVLAYYDVRNNTIVVAPEATFNTKVHEMFHVAYHIYLEMEDAIYRRSCSSFIDEAMNANMTKKVADDESYFIERKVLEYLQTCVYYDYTVYSRNSIEYLIQMLKDKYVGVDIDFIVDAVDDIKTKRAATGEVTYLDQVPNLISELFRICVLNIDVESEDVYKPFRDFLNLAGALKDNEILLTYLEDYNQNLIDRGYNKVISSKDLEDRCNNFKQIKMLFTDENGVYPIINEEAPYIEIDASGKTFPTSCNLNGMFIVCNDLYYYIRVSALKHFNDLGTQEYWQDFLDEYEIAKPFAYKNVDITFNGEVIANDYLPSCKVLVAEDKEGNIQFVLKTSEGEVIYESSPDIIKILGIIQLSDYVKIEAMGDVDISLVLNQDYLIDYLKTGENKFLEVDRETSTIKSYDFRNINEDWQLCLESIPYAGGYGPFSEFVLKNKSALKLEYGFPNDEDKSYEEYLEEYNKELKKNGFRTISYEEINKVLEEYKGVSKLAISNEGIKPVLDDSEIYNRVDTSYVHVWNLDFYMKLMLLDYFPSFDIPEFWEKLVRDNLLVQPYYYDEFTFTINKEEVYRGHMYDLKVLIGKSNTGDIGIILKDNIGNILYQSLDVDEIMSVVNLGNYVNSLEYDGTKVDITRVLTEDYLKLPSATRGFTGLNYIGGQWHQSMRESLDFQVALENISYNSGNMYESLEAFIRKFGNQPGFDLFYYVKLYNKELETRGYPNIITTEMAKEKYAKFINVGKIAVTGAGLRGLVSINGIDYMINQNGNLENTLNYDISFSSNSMAYFIASTLFTHYEELGSSLYWEFILEEFMGLKPSAYVPKVLYIGSEYVGTQVIGNYNISVGLNADKQIGFIIRDKDNKVFYSSRNDILRETSIGSLYSYLDNPDSEIIDLNQVLDERVMIPKMASRSYVFPDITFNDDGTIDIDPLYKVKVISNNGYNSTLLKSCYLINGDGGVMIYPLDVVVPFLDAIGDISLKEVLVNMGILNPDKLEYSFTEEEISELILTYLTLKQEELTR